MHASRHASRAAPAPTPAQADAIAGTVERQTNAHTEDVMVLQRWNGKLIAERFHLPDMEVEIERAVDQVELAIKGREELVEEKMELERATAAPGHADMDPPHDSAEKHAKVNGSIRQTAERVAGAPGPR